MIIQIVKNHTNFVNPAFIKACRILINKYKENLEQESDPKLKKKLLLKFWRKEFDSSLCLCENGIFKKIVFNSEHDKIIFLLKFN